MFFCTPGQHLRNFSAGEEAEEFQREKGELKVQRVERKYMQAEN